MNHRPVEDGAGLPRIAWMLWFQGWDAAPDVARACLDNVRCANPDWRVVALDADNLRDHLPSETLDWIDALPATPTGRSNLVRLLLLQRHGGVWLDATCLCATPLDAWIHDLAGSGFFAFTAPASGNALATWFLASRPDATIVNAWLAAALGYWNGRGTAHDYFWVQPLFADLIAYHPTVRSAWSRVPSVTAAHRFHFGPNAVRLPAPPYPPDIAGLAAPPAPIFKLTSKLSDDFAADSLMRQLLDLDPHDAGRVAYVMDWARGTRTSVEVAA